MIFLFAHHGACRQPSLRLQPPGNGSVGAWRKGVGELLFHAVPLQTSQVWLGMAIVMQAENGDSLGIGHSVNSARDGTISRSICGGPKKLPTKRPFDNGNLQLDVSTKGYSIKNPPDFHV